VITAAAVELGLVVLRPLVEALMVFSDMSAGS
jgi:hypothetical protein